MAVEKAPALYENWSLVPMRKPAILSMPAAGDSARIDFWLRIRTTGQTNAKYRRKIELFLAWAGCPLGEVTAPRVVEYLEHLARSGCTAGTRNNTLSIIRSLYDTMRRHWPAENWPYLADILPARQPGKLHQRVLSRAEVAALLAVPAGQPLLRFLYETAARISETLALQWRDIVPAGEGYAVWLYGKGGKTRMVMISTELYELLNQHEKHSARVFPLGGTKAHWIIAGAAQKAGIDGAKNVSAHWLRHSRLSHLAEAGVDAVSLRDFAGHESINTTNIYLHMTREARLMPDTLAETRGEHG